jgi:hypothetical protein
VKVENPLAGPGLGGAEGGLRLIMEPRKFHLVQEEKIASEAEDINEQG